MGKADGFFADGAAAWLVPAPPENVPPPPLASVVREGADAAGAIDAASAATDISAGLVPAPAADGRGATTIVASPLSSRASAASGGAATAARIAAMNSAADA